VREIAYLEGSALSRSAVIVGAKIANYRSDMDRWIAGH
jgi:hypothetical protein